MSRSTEQLLRMTLIVYLMIGAVITGSFAGTMVKSFASKTSVLLVSEAFVSNCLQSQ